MKGLTTVSLKGPYAPIILQDTRFVKVFWYKFLAVARILRGSQMVGD